MYVNSYVREYIKKKHVCCMAVVSSCCEVFGSFLLTSATLTFHLGICQ